MSRKPLAGWLALTLLCSLGLVSEGAEPAKGVTVTGRYKGRKAGQSIPDTLVALCRVSGDYQCVLSRDLMAVTDAEGRFVVRNVPPGLYTVAHTKGKKPADASFSGSATLTQKQFALRTEEGWFSMGELKDGTISLSATPAGIPLSFEIRDKKLVALDVDADKHEIEVVSYGE